MTIKEFDEDFEAEILHNLTEDVENDNSKENSIIAPEDSIRNTVEKADVLTDVICKNDVTNKTDMEIQSPERQRYTNGDIDSVSFLFIPLKVFIFSFFSALNT